MPQIINTNIASLSAQRNLNGSQGMLNTALERLSSGLRINSAKDDAAGLAISERYFFCAFSSLYFVFCWELEDGIHRREIGISTMPFYEI